MLANNLTPKKSNSALWGYVDETDTWIINPQFHEADTFHDGYARVTRWYSHNGYFIPCYNFLNVKGELLLKADCDYASEFLNRFAVIGNRIGEIYPYSTSNANLPAYEMCLVDTTGREYGSMYANIMLPPDSLGIVAFMHHDWSYNFELGNIYYPKFGIVCIDSIINPNSAILKASLYSDKESPAQVFIENDTIFARNYKSKLNSLADYLSHSIQQNHEGYQRTAENASILNSSGDTIVPFVENNSENLRYSHVIYPINADKGRTEWYIVSEHGLYGLLHKNDKSSRLVIPTSFSKITVFMDSILLCKYYNDKELLYNTDGDVVGKPHNKLRYMSDKLVLTGDYTGRYTYDFYEGSTPIVTYGVMSKTGDMILPALFECKQREYGVLLIGNSLWAVKNGLWGAYDMNGNQIVLHRYRDIMQSVFGPRENNLVHLADSIGRVTIFDKNGRDIAGPIFARTSNSDCHHEHQLIKLYGSNLYGIMRLDGEISVKPCYDDIDMVLDFPIAKACKKSKWGIIALNGKQLIQCKYDKITIDTDKDGNCICQCTIGNFINTIIFDKEQL